MKGRRSWEEDTAEGRRRKSDRHRTVEPVTRYELGRVHGTLSSALLAVCAAVTDDRNPKKSGYLRCLDQVDCSSFTDLSDSQNYNRIVLYTVLRWYTEMINIFFILWQSFFILILERILSDRILPVLRNRGILPWIKLIMLLKKIKRRVSLW